MVLRYVIALYVGAAMSAVHMIAFGGSLLQGLVIAYLPVIVLIAIRKV